MVERSLTKPVEPMSLKDYQRWSGTMPEHFRSTAPPISVMNSRRFIDQSSDRGSHPSISLGVGSGHAGALAYGSLRRVENGRRSLSHAVTRRASPSAAWFLSWFAD